MIIGETPGKFEGFYTEVSGCKQVTCNPQPGLGNKKSRLPVYNGSREQPSNSLAWGFGFRVKGYEFTRNSKLGISF